MERPASHIATPGAVCMAILLFIIIEPGVGRKNRIHLAADQHLLFPLVCRDMNGSMKLIDSLA